MIRKFLSRLSRAALMLLSLALWPLLAAADSASVPIVFVHGSSGSAAQFETHAMRFTSNGFPQKRLYAFEYDTSVTTNGALVLAQLDAYLDRVRAENGVDKVHVAAHSRGTSVMTAYLNTYPGGSAKVARYVNIDGRFQPDLPGGVPTIGIWGEWNSGGAYARLPGRTLIGPNPEDNFHFPEKGHTEVATSAEAFALMYRFFLGEEPRVTFVVPQQPDKVRISGRAVIFPQNVGYAGATLEVWRVAADSGQRIGKAPLATKILDASGAFGPLAVDGRHHYEFALTRADGSVHHFYQERFSRSNHFVRLNSSIPGTGLDLLIPKSERHAVLNLSRQREFWGDQGERTDRLSINGTEMLTPQIAPRTQVVLAAYAMDAGLDGQTDLGKGMLAPFETIPFISAADVFVPASLRADGVVRVVLRSRDASRLVQINVPNWASSRDRISVQFRDDALPFGDYAGYLRHQARCKVKPKLGLEPGAYCR